jgi:hypothetical protein
MTFVDVDQPIGRAVVRKGMGGHPNQVSQEPCELAHARISLALDGELTRLEALRLRAHVATCADCAGYRQDLARATAALRASAPALPHRAGAWPRAAPAAARARLLPIVAAVALIGLGVAVSGGLPGGHKSVGALSAAQGMPVYGGLRPDQGLPAYAPAGSAPGPFLALLR